MCTLKYCGENGLYIDDGNLTLRSFQLLTKSNWFMNECIVILYIFEAVLDHIGLDLIEISCFVPRCRVVLVDNGSQDGTAKNIGTLIASLSLTLYHLKKIWA